MHFVYFEQHPGTAQPTQTQKGVRTWTNKQTMGQFSVAFFAAEADIVENTLDVLVMIVMVVVSDQHCLFHFECSAPVIHIYLYILHATFCPTCFLNSCFPNIGFAWFLLVSLLFASLDRSWFWTSLIHTLIKDVGQWTFLIKNNNATQNKALSD